MSGKKLTKSLVFGDIHWGRRNSSEVHNTDCLNYMLWLVQVAITEGIDHVIFVGDWFETRSSINIHTLNFAHAGMKALTDLGVPVYMVVGNHDCYYKHTRSIHSLVGYAEFENVHVIDDITPVPEIGDGVLLVPYAFPKEYEEELPKYLSMPAWFGHFEFQGFVITGQHHRMMTGPKPSDFVGPQIFSGHFHKRQTMGNITYIGNPFPMDYSDAGDVNRGCMIYDHTDHTFSFRDWEAGPRYQRIMLSTLLDNGPDDLLWDGANVKCMVDRQINYEESLTIKDLMVDQFKLREFSLEETVNLNEVARDTVVEIDEDEELEGIDDLVVRLLGGLQTEQIQPQVLIDIYNSLGGRSS